MNRKPILISVLLILALVILVVLVISKNSGGTRIPKENATFDEIIDKYTNVGWRVIDDQRGQLNNDSHEDRVVVLDTDVKGIENNRLLIILFGLPNGLYDTSIVSDTAVRCSTCGGVGGNGDPFSRIAINGQSLEIHHTSGSLTRYAETESYLYLSGEWLLSTTTVTTFNANDPTVLISTETKTSKDFGKRVINPIVQK
ncbi:MAG TPA: hypothetical protein VI953_01160 [Candidatus Paceibacterota bacterium]